MKKMRFLVLLTCLAVTASAWAEFINENQARTTAARFMASHAIKSTNIKMAHKAPCMNATSSNQMAYYVFNTADQGYVIVAGDDRAPAVLGYSDKGTFDKENVPEAMQWLLDSYATQIEELNKGAKAAPVTRSGDAIRPLVTAMWSQNSPYNSMLPMLNNGKQAVSGCVATALAQVLYYWKQPARPTQTIPAYTSRSFGIYMPALEPADIIWDAMQDTYLSNDTESEGAQAAALLTLYCAQLVNMDFQYGASAANGRAIPAAISTYMGYKASAHCENRENFSTQTWADYIYNELAEGRPVIYSGSKRTGGHSFVCDGYDGEGMFHMNWGWDGMSNGYYLLNVVNPDAQGTGSSAGNYGYILEQYIVAGIEPGEEDYVFALTAGNVTLHDAVTTRYSSDANFQATVTGHFYNYTIGTFDASYGWGLYQGDELISVPFESGVGSLPPGYYTSTRNEPLNFGAGITSGTYRIVPIYSELWAGNWRPCIGSDVNYIEVTIDGDNCIVTGYGTAGERNYIVNDINYEGSMHNGRPVNVTVNLTNIGYSQNEVLYFFLNGSLNSLGYVSLEHGETGDVHFTFEPQQPGEYTIGFSFNEDGSDLIGYTILTIYEMSPADLDIQYEVLNVTDPANYIVTSDKFSLRLSITNNSTYGYDDDITVKLYKNLDGTYGANTQEVSQHLTMYPGTLNIVEFDLDNVINGWDYFAAIYCYSEGHPVFVTATPYYTIVFPEEPVIPEVLIGDVNNDGYVTIGDVTALIDHLLGGGDGINLDAADVNGSGDVSIGDVTALIDFLLEGGN